MPVQLQHPDIGGTFLDRYRTAIDAQERAADRAFTRKRLVRADERAEIEFGDAQQQKNALKVAQLAFSFKDKPQEYAAFWSNPSNYADLNLPPGFKPPPFEQLDQVIARARSMADMQSQANDDRTFGLKEREFGLQQQKFGLDRMQTMASIGASNASADLARANAAYVRSGKGQYAKPLSSSLQKEENNFLALAQVATGNNEDVTRMVRQIDDGTLDPGRIVDAYQDAKGWAGTVDGSDVRAVNYNEFIVGLERMRSNSLKLAKGPQTDSDAKREWDALFRNIHDKTLVRAQLDRIARLDARNVRHSAALLRNQRKNQGLDDPDWEDLGVNPDFVYEPKAPTTFTRGGAGVFDAGQAGQQIGGGTAADGWKVERVR